MQPPGYYYASDNSSVGSFDLYNAHLNRNEDPTLQFPDPRSWPPLGSYDIPSMAPLHISAPENMYQTNGTLQATFPRSDESQFEPCSAAYQPHPSPARILTPGPLPHDTAIAHDAENISKPKFPKQPSLLDDYPQLMFPTPSELLNDLTTAKDDAAATGDKHESQRKARQRALAESVGFTPTDP